MYSETAPFGPVAGDLEMSDAPVQPANTPDRWMELYQQADPEAATALVHAISPALLRFFRAHPGSREHAEDLLQETWMRIHRVRHTYRSGMPVLPWVFAIARRVCIDNYRRNRRIMAHETAAVAVLPETNNVENRPDFASFDRLVAALPESQREVITLLKAAGLSLEEVARATSSTVGSVKQKAHRAYTTLRRLITERVDSGPDGSSR